MNRIFLAMPVTLFDYDKLQDDFNKVLEGRWVQAQNLHLTLQFFGNMYEEEYLIEKLTSLELQAPSCELRGLALLNQEQILYAQVENSLLINNYIRIQEAFAYQSEQTFIPHVTLMRIKKISDKTHLENKIEEYKEKSLGILHPRIELIQSTLTPQGATYTTIRTLPL